METPQHDLWPATFGNGAIRVVNTPVRLLKEQASLLATKTDNMVEAEVLTTPVKDLMTPSPSKFLKRFPNNGFRHAFYLRAPTLGNFRYLLFEIGQPIEMYPLIINDAPIEEGEIEVSNQEEFMEALRKIFANKKTQKVIQAMIAQSFDSLPTIV